MISRKLIVNLCLGAVFMLLVSAMTLAVNFEVQCPTDVTEGDSFSCDLLLSSGQSEGLSAMSFSVTGSENFKVDKVDIKARGATDVSDPSVGRYGFFLIMNPIASESVLATLNFNTQVVGFDNVELNPITIKYGETTYSAANNNLGEVIISSPTVKVNSLPTCTPVSATCAATGISCPNGVETVDPKIVCGSNQNCVSGICKTVDPTSVCGNGIIESPEECDGDISCTTTEGYSGTQHCAENCAGYFPCTSTESCGDEIVNGPEECDGEADCSATCNKGAACLAECPSARVCGLYPDDCGGELNCGTCDDKFTCTNNECIQDTPSTDEEFEGLMGQIRNILKSDQDVLQKLTLVAKELAGKIGLFN
jgi:hypothetical protein